MHLIAGEHILQAVCCGSNRDFRHTVWVLKEDIPPINTVDMNEAAAHNTVVVALASFNQNDVPKRLNILARSARKHGIWFSAFGVNTAYSNYNQKINALIRCLRELPDCYKYIIYLDGSNYIFSVNH